MLDTVPEPEGVAMEAVASGLLLVLSTPLPLAHCVVEALKLALADWHSEAGGEGLAHALACPVALHMGLALCVCHSEGELSGEAET